MYYERVYAKIGFKNCDSASNIIMNITENTSEKKSDDILTLSHI